MSSKIVLERVICGVLMTRAELSPDWRVKGVQGHPDLSMRYDKGAAIVSLTGDRDHIVLGTFRSMEQAVQSMQRGGHRMERPAPNGLARPVRQPLPGWIVSTEGRPDHFVAARGRTPVVSDLTRRADIFLVEPVVTTAEGTAVRYLLG